MIEDSDKIVERLLAGLRAAQPPHGMERRIVIALEQLEASPRQTRLWPRWSEHAFSRRLLLCGVALSAAIAVFLALTTIRRHGIPPASIATRTSPLPTPPVADAAPASERKPPPTTDSSINKPGTINKQRPMDRPRTKAAAHEVVRNVTPLHITPETGFPAPPMPLTAQEKLLLKLAHRGDPEQLAMLTHLVAVQIEEEKRDVTDFFGQPDKGDHE